MFPEKPVRGSFRARRPGVELEEERAWVSFYARVTHDPAMAAEVLSQLESDPELRRERLALYLRCKESVQTHKARQLRNKRIGQAVRRLLHVLLVRPLVALGRLFDLGGGLAIECLPETTGDGARDAAAAPAQQQRRRPNLVPNTRATAELAGQATAGTRMGTGTADAHEPRAKASSIQA